MSRWENAILLTKSDKYKGFCVVALRTADNHLIRLVSSDEDTHGAISTETLTRPDGTLFQPLDRIQAPIQCPAPATHQPENYLLRDNTSFFPVSTMTQDDVLSLCPIQRTGLIFGNCNYRLYEQFLPNHSIEMVEVQDLYLYSSYIWSKHPKASFTFDGRHYGNMSFTDPDFSFANLDPSYYTVKDNHKVLRRAVLVVSLPDVPFWSDSSYYIFVAKVFPLPPVD